MADVEAAAAAFLENEIQQQEYSQATEVIDDQASAPASPFEALQSRLREHPYDTTAWQDLVNIAEDSGDFKLINTAYSSLLKVYPNTVQAQVAYLRHSQRAYPPGKPTTQDPPPIPTPQALFSQWLKQSPDVELWKLYLDYVRLVVFSPRDVIKKAFEFALRFVGQDRDAGEIWKEYIEYIKADPTSTEREGQEKMDLLRSVYRRAVQIPLDNLEQIWREWDAFENGLNKLTAKKFLADVSPDYMTARTKKTELAEHHKRIRLYPSMIHGERAALDLPVPPVMRSEERSLLAAWRKYLEFEESNPLEIEEKSMLNARILAIYRKAVIKMRFYPEVWHLAYLWSQTNGKADDAHGFLKNGLDANPTSFLLNFSYTEHQEQAMKKAEIHEIFRKFTTILKKELDDLEEQHVAEGGNRVSQQPAGATKAPVPNERMEGILIDKRTELGQASLAWLRYAKRVGQSVGMRNTFKEIRSDKWVCWQVYEAAAILEHQLAPTSDVSSKIFELGLRLFGTDVDYVVRYLNFLINKCDEANARALFEKSVGVFEAEKARPIWQRWLMYQMNVADLPTLHKLDKRVAEAYPKGLLA
ncbi:hypothetical protein M408DRAFT_62773 [Serendipita vermifera MAFF 305830]|uniref:mRNA 3'-end-processing protein RNA14 n=1 Tax=Serendipita vermifera MAFF 305830 TaxID=933852 RepID=A0A0C3BML1_SERVB|nr:hypothetical protein M408DRAFT_62773 [Serendipita vermifera MAFF 305830]